MTSQNLALDALRRAVAGDPLSGAGLEVISPQLLALTAIGAAFFALAALRFRKALLAAQ